MKQAVWIDQPQQALEPCAVRETQWRRRLADGDIDVIALIYDHYAAPMYRVLAAILGTSADAEDALQEVFVRLAQGRARRVADLGPYLFTAARHEAINILRRKRRERPLEDTDRSSAPHEPGPDLEMNAMLLRLPLEQREVIAMKIYQEMTFAEIAAIVKASPNTVASRYRYGIERLRGWMNEELTDGKLI